MAVCAAILCQAVRVCDVMNKSSICGSRVYDVMSQPFLFFFSKERPGMAAPEELQFKFEA